MEVHRRLMQTSFPRVQMMVILALAGLGSFLSSATLLALGFDGMTLRYALAAALGYLMFLLLVRLWIAYQERSLSLDGLDGVDLLDVDLPNLNLTGSAVAESFGGGGGGSFGGGGASGSWGDSGGGGGLADLDGGADLDEAWPIVLAVVALLAGIAALGFVVYSSPMMFAEVLLDAAVVGAVFKRTRRHQRRHWLHGVVRRTWIPGVVLVLFAAVGGFALQAAQPEAHTLGEVLHAEDQRP
jgi:hypothetical protein